MLRRLATATALALALPASAAAAPSDDRIFIDPKAPAAAEYALPLEAGRREGLPPSIANARRAPGSVPLFGAGLGGRGGAGDGGRAGRGSRGRASAREAPPEAAIDGANTGLWPLAIAALALVAGALLGLALRRRRRAEPESPA